MLQMKMEKKDLVTSINKLIKAGKLELKTQVLTLLDSFLSSCQCINHQQLTQKSQGSGNVKPQHWWLDLKSIAGITLVKYQLTSQGSILIYLLRDAKASENTKGMGQEEKIVYNIIEKSGNKGMSVTQYLALKF